MANLKEIRNRIASIKSTRQITSAMKMVAAAYLRKAQARIFQLRPYAVKLDEILMDVTEHSSVAEENPFTQEREPERALIVVLSSNRGLCGSFNANAVKKATTLAEEQEPFKSLAVAGKLDYLAIGKKASDLLKARKYPLAGNRNEVYDELTYENAAAIAKELMQDFTDGKYDRVEVVYNEFKNPAVQILRQVQYLPVKVETKKREIPVKGMRPDFIFEPGEEKIVRELIPKALKIKLYRMLAESYASEQGARMTAMHQATDNATDLIGDLTLSYNKARQAAITNELLDIVGGANALG